jgi:hypothetical protein
MTRLLFVPLSNQIKKHRHGLQTSIEQIIFFEQDIYLQLVSDTFQQT